MDQTPAQRIYYALRSAARLNRRFGAPQGSFMLGTRIDDSTLRDFELLVRNGHRNWSDRCDTRQKEIARLKGEIANLHRFPS